MEVEIVQATIEHAADLGPRLRRQDKLELMYSCGLGGKDALTESVHFSKFCWIALIDGVPEVMWGVAEHPVDNSLGIIWLLSSEEMYKIPGRFIRESHSYVSMMLKHFDTVFNYVHAENIKSLKWLEKLGFIAGERIEEYGVGKQPFILYARSN